MLCRWNLGFSRLGFFIGNQYLNSFNEHFKARNLPIQLANSKFSMAECCSRSITNVLLPENLTALLRFVDMI